MNASTILKTIEELKTFSISVQAWEILNKLKEEAEKDIRLQTAKQSGNGNRLKAAEKFLKNCQKMHPTQTKLHKANNANGLQHLCDGYTAFILAQPLPLEATENNPEYPDIKRLIDNASKNDGAKLTLPTIPELKKYIKIEKAKKSPSNYVGLRGRLTTRKRSISFNCS